MYSVIAGLNKTKPRDWMGRYIMAFLLYYDAGQAADLADGLTDENFWDRLIELEGEGFQKLKRGTERRHFRGAAALKALQNFKNRPINQPWSLLKHMYYGDIVSYEPQDDPTYTELYKRMTNAYSGTQFGPYFIWKLYDIFNVCLDMPITLSLDEALKYMPEEPRKAAIAIFGDFQRGLIKVADYVNQFDHPVRPGRCEYAEAETVLCMLKGAFLTRTHTIGDDIYEKRVQLELHSELRELLPPLVPAKEYPLGDLTV